jgi:hypothetical protein
VIERPCLIWLCHEGLHVMPVGQVQRHLKGPLQDAATRGRKVQGHDQDAHRYPATRRSCVWVLDSRRKRVTIAGSFQRIGLIRIVPVLRTG